MIRFSIVIPCFNAADTLEATLSSLVAQSFENWEAICIDDGSTDATQALLVDAAARDARIRIASNPKKGPSAARNHGALDLAQGEIIAFCDADDLWSPRKLTELDRAFGDAGVGAAYGRVAFFKNRVEDASSTTTVLNQALTIPTLLAENPVCTMSNLSVRRDIIQSVGGLDEAVVHNEDLEWLIRLVGHGVTITGLPALQTFYRTSPQGLSSDLSAMAQGRASAVRTAARFGVRPDSRAEAVYHRYLARRALRLGLPAAIALRHAISGVINSPLGFFNSARRGVLTLVGALVATLLPRQAAYRLFNR